IVFGLPLAGHLTGFAIMTFFTAAVVSSFGLLLATLAKSRAQLSGISTILILSISAIGGSMFPRFLMSEGMQKLGFFTFKTRALGIVEPAKAKETKPRSRTPGRKTEVELMGVPIPAVKTADGLRATSSGRPVPPQTVGHYLDSRFGDELGAVRAAMKRLAT